MSAKDECLPASRRKEVMSVILRACRRPTVRARRARESQGKVQLGRAELRAHEEAAGGSVSVTGTHSTPQDGLRGP